MTGTIKINKLEENSRFLGKNEETIHKENSKEFMRELLNEDFSDIEATCRSDVSFFGDPEELSEAEISELESEFENLVEP